MTRFGPAVAAAIFAIVWLAAARQSLIVQPTLAIAFVALNAWLLGVVAVWELRSRGHRDWPIYLLVFGPIVLLLIAVRMILGRSPQEP